MTQAKKTTEKQLVERLVGLRLAADKARTRLMVALMEAERDHMASIEAWGHSSFDAFIKAHDFCRPDAYRDFVAGMEAVGDADVAETIGANAVRLAAKVPQSRRADYIASMMQSVSDNHKQPSEGAARSAAVKCEMPTELRSLNNAREIERLRAENAVLKAENRKLRAQLERLSKKAA